MYNSIPKNTACEIMVSMSDRCRAGVMLYYYVIRNIQDTKNLEFYKVKCQARKYSLEVNNELYKGI